MPYVKNGELDIYFETFGEGEPLILIMGLGADGAVWEQHRDYYKEHFQCIAIDNRGVGQSSKPTGSYSTDQMASDVIAVCDHLSLDQFRVAGISMGGAVAQKVCLNYPGRVKSQVLISTWSQCDLYSKKVFENMKSHRAHVKPSDFMQYLQILIFAAGHFQSNYDDLAEAQRAADENPDSQPQYGFDAQCDACISHNTSDRLGEIQIPTLITVGDKDIFTPRHFSENLHENIKGSRLIVYPDVGHAHHWEVLERFNEDTRQFLLEH